MEETQNNKQQNNINDWIEKDITSDAIYDRLPKAFCIDNYVGKIHSVIQSGRFPILTGDSVVGKTAVF